jgi:ribosomal protein L30E
MSLFCHDDVLDAALNYIKSNASRICVCSAQPTTYTEAITTYKLADINISAANFTGPANGDVSGRKLGVNAQDAVDIDASGNATHVALVDTTNLKLLYVAVCPLHVLVAGNFVNIPAWDIEFSDPQ